MSTRPASCELEAVRYAFFFRPRGFGKSCWVSLLQNYYDRSAGHRFESLFAGTDIGRRPTPDRNRYVIRHVAEAMTVLDEWYRGYRFAEAARNDLCHTNLVLRYLAESIPNAGPPDDLIDRHVRIDYGNHLLSVNRQFGDNFDLLRQLACEGTVYGAVRDGFLLEDLAEPQNLPSLLHYVGLLSIRAAREHAPLLGIPNQTVRRLLCGSRGDG